MSSNDWVAGGVALFALGFACGLIAAERGADSMRTQYLEQCHAPDEVWVQMQTSAVRCERPRRRR